jgi:F0F1-type ATP synthase assembly protein I
MRSQSWLITSFQFLGIGWYLAISIVAGTFGGAWLDGLVGSSPVFLLLGLLLGVIVAFYGTYRMTRAFLIHDDDSGRCE